MRISTILLAAFVVAVTNADGQHTRPSIRKEGRRQQQKLTSRRRIKGKAPRHLQTATTRGKGSKDYLDQIVSIDSDDETGRDGGDSTTAFVVEGALVVTPRPTKAPKSTKAPTTDRPSNAPITRMPTPAPTRVPTKAPAVSLAVANIIPAPSVPVVTTPGLNSGVPVVSPVVDNGTADNGSNNNANGWTATTATASSLPAPDAVNTAALTTFDNKCDAATAGGEFKSDVSVPVYYQYELVTSADRDVLEIADIIDKAVQHFLAVWLVDCGTTPDTAIDPGTDATTAAAFGAATATTAANSDFANRRNRALLEQQQQHRQTQLTMAPIVGTGVGEPDTVLLEGTEDQECTNLTSSGLLGQTCYRVIGSFLVYLDESMSVDEKDIRDLAIETLTVGINYAATDFTQLDPDIFGLYLLKSYDEVPKEVLRDNFDSNQRDWNSVKENPWVNNPDEGYSHGAKFGIAFATLLCIALLILLCVYMYKNRVELFGDVDWANCCCCFCFDGGRSDKSLRPVNQNKHANLDDDITLPSKVDSSSSGQQSPYDNANNNPPNGDLKLSFRSFNGSPTSTAGSTGTRPLSPDPETPRNDLSQQLQQSREQEAQPVYLEESNICTPRSEWSSARSYVSDDVSDMVHSTTSSERLHMRLSKEAIRGGSGRKPSQLVSPARSPTINDTVEL